jgi:hypothetical protein
VHRIILEVYNLTIGNFSKSNPKLSDPKLSDPNPIRVCQSVKTTPLGGLPSRINNLCIPGKDLIN